MLKDGGIEFFDPNDNSLSGLAVSEADLGGNIAAAVVATPTKGYAIVGILSTDTHVVSFNPETGEKLETLLEADGWIYDALALKPDGTELWITDRTSTSPGVRIFDTQTDTEITSEPINVGLPPTAICFTGV